MLKVDKSKCSGDTLCTMACPTGAAFMNDDGKAEIDVDECIECFACISVCPEEAIKEVDED